LVRPVPPIRDPWFLLVGPVYVLSVLCTTVIHTRQQYLQNRGGGVNDCNTYRTEEEEAELMIREKGLGDKRGEAGGGVSDRRQEQKAESRH